MAERLCGVEQEGNFSLCRDAPDFFRRLDGTGDVGSVQHCNQPSTRKDGGGYVIRADEPFAVAADIRDSDIPFLLMEP
jgi:hypothetical protein